MTKRKRWALNTLGNKKREILLVGDGDPHLWGYPYLWIGDAGEHRDCFGTLSGPKLRGLRDAITRALRGRGA